MLKSLYVRLHHSLHKHELWLAKSLWSNIIANNVPRVLVKMLKISNPWLGKIQKLTVITFRYGMSDFGLFMDFVSHSWYQSTNIFYKYTRTYTIRGEYNIIHLIFVHKLINNDEVQPVIKIIVNGCTDTLWQQVEVLRVLWWMLMNDLVKLMICCEFNRASIGYKTRSCFTDLK